MMNSAGDEPPEAGNYTHALLRECEKLLRSSADLKIASKSVENHGLVPVEENPVVDVPAHRAGEHNFFKIAPFLQQVVERITVRDANHVLLDDRAVVEHLGDVMAGR